MRTADAKPRPFARIAARAPTHAPTHAPPHRRPKRNIKTAMNHEILLYGIAQKVRGRATTNHAYSHPDMRSPLSLAAFQEQLGFDKAVEVRP